MRLFPSLPASPALASALAVAGLLAGCLDMGQVTVNTTAKVLVRAQPSLKAEADYELASRAIPGTLKTVEGFWVVNPGNTTLLDILTEGYCQYGIGFVEDEWEDAVVRKDFEAQAYHSARATKMFTRCLNYALLRLGGKWREDLFADGPDAADRAANRIKSAVSGQRTPLLWAALALGSAINQNKDNVEMIQYAGTAKAMLFKVLEIDAAHQLVEALQAPLR